jgi:hypothetical protein
MRTLFYVSAISFLLSPSVAAQHAGVASTLHNLSVTGPGEFKSQTETEVCKFCHIPHNAVVPEPLWGHALSKVAQYKVPRIRRGGKVGEPAPQPDGSSRMCLSCHDGTVALGKIAGKSKRVKMAGAERLGPGQKGFLGTDLSGSHPISFVVPDGDPGGADGARDMVIKPLPANESAGGALLDNKGKMQCTTCHDPHSDQYYQLDRVPHFWARPTVEEVCLTCHALR